VAIQSFGDKLTQAFFETGKAGRAPWANVAVTARRKLDMVHYAAELVDLRVPPGNRLESLSGDLAGFYSIRINDQWRIVFSWSSAGPASVRIMDYH
jgi:proteic killer suppression protein